jgi:hypothetical protein
MPQRKRRKRKKDRKPRAPYVRSKKGIAPLSRTQIAAILRLRGKLPQHEIASMYGITQAYVCMLFKRAGVEYGVYVRRKVDAGGNANARDKSSK